MAQPNSPAQNSAPFLQRHQPTSGESYLLSHALGRTEGSIRQIPTPRATAIFGPTFRGEQVIRLDDVTKDPRYGQSAPFYGMPKGHLPVRQLSRGSCEESHRGRSRRPLLRPLGTRPIHRAARGTGGRDRGVGVAGPGECASLWRVAGGEPRQGRVSRDAVSRAADAAQRHSWLRADDPLGTRRARDKHGRAVETIERNATSLTQIVEDVLDVSRIISGKIRLDVQPVVVPALIRHALDAVTPAADAKGIRLEAELDARQHPECQATPIGFSR